MGGTQRSVLDESEEETCKALCTLPGEAGAADLIVAVTANRKLILVSHESFGPMTVIGPPVTLAVAELMATAVLAGDGDVAAHPETLHAVCLAVVAQKAWRERAADPAQLGAALPRSGAVAEQTKERVAA